MPLEIRGEYSVNYSWSEDRRTLLAYLYNVSSHVRERIMLGGTYHRIPKPAPLTFRFRTLPEAKLQMRLFDLDARRIQLEAAVQSGAEYDLGTSDRDFFILVNA